ncbi:uncharacterized protein [Gossypium hirsutum]|uniref:Uncharacterized protein isoform X1 n=1 Tax=Gossypium hirsutum TaxID=3635 RepID=A0A1U8MME1_GOSHI|nr:uncharacterized protein LOC107938135 isoform X1 [Gossypium hirsutum]
MNDEIKKNRLFVLSSHLTLCLWHLPSWLWRKKLPLLLLPLILLPYLTKSSTRKYQLPWCMKMIREDFEMTGISTLVTVGVRDIQGEGFPDQFSGLADSVFLDLPQPLASHSFSLKHVETRWNSVFLLTVHRTSATFI